MYDSPKFWVLVMTLFLATEVIGQMAGAGVHATSGVIFCGFMFVGEKIDEINNE
jgi:hypothetical protein